VVLSIAGALGGKSTFRGHRYLAGGARVTRPGAGARAALVGSSTKLPLLALCLDNTKTLIDRSETVSSSPPLGREDKGMDKYIEAHHGPGVLQDPVCVCMGRSGVCERCICVSV
jgi:hypothetical protein